MTSHSNITGSLIASLHPLVIMNISEHWTRLKAQNSSEQQVVGALIGKQEGRNIEIMNSFELLFDRIEMDIIIDKTYYLQKENQFKQVFPDLDFLGWYTTGDSPDESDIRVHQQILEINESPVLLKLNPYSRHTKLPVKMFETIIDIVNGEPKMLFVDLNYTIKTEEAERIGLDHVAKLSATPQGADSHSSVVSEHLGCQLNAVKMLRDRISLVLAYVKDTQKGNIPWNDEILREAHNLCHRLPVINNGQYSEQFYNQCNDVALITYLSTITKASNTLNQFVNKFNILYDRQGVGRRIRALFM
ncbi:COP9 signalosome complex subunit 6-like [Panonychus citri]|uniref:COP9 signalosome complex subunit 6-like n=1 Tax=Panonychus citri TaxID=50023 RepID=UPI0023082EF3|nr:COP9 signalosome complex subunit 6-like [Panonychus citri]